MNTQNIILVGGGRFGREVAAWIKTLGTPYRNVGFLDDEKNLPEIIGRIIGHEPKMDSVYLTCLGHGKARSDIRGALESRGAKFVNLIDPLVRTTSSLDGTSNSIFLGMSSLANNVSIGNDLLIHAFAVVGHDVSIGNGVTIGSHGFIGGGATLEDRCTIHPNATVLPDITIGEGAVVGAGAVVIKNVAPYSSVFGSPAKIVAYGKRLD